MEPIITITLIGMAAKSIIVYMAVNDRLPIDPPLLYRGRAIAKK